MNRTRDLLLLAVFTLLLHAPFLTQPVEGDEVNYLDVAQNVLRHPLTPQNFRFVFQGQWVNMAGHPHPPMNGYVAALAWIVCGGFSVPGFHAFYLLFALMISFAAYALAARFTAHALWGALLVAASPIVQANTNTLAGAESPGLAFLLAGAAAFFWRRFWIAGIALTLAGLTELQALALPPILMLEYALRRERPPRAAWIAVAAPYIGMAGWQALQFSLTHTLPGAVLVGYMRESSRGRASLKMESALALVGHLGVLVTLVPIAWRRLWGVVPGLIACTLVHDYAWWERMMLVAAVTLGVNALLWLWNARKTNSVLAWWCLAYFLFACVAFYAGAARYLLPIVAPMAMLVVIERRALWRWAALGVSLVLGLNISFAAYEFARVYADVRMPFKHFLVNGEWGFRYYMLQQGGEMLEANSVPRPGEWIVASELSLAGNYGSLAEEIATPLQTVDLDVRTPLRLVDRYAHSGYSSVSFGLLPFSFSTRPLDRITYSRTSPYLDVAEWTPTEFSGRLVYLAKPGTSVKIRVDHAMLHFVLFARGQGTATFHAGHFSKTVDVNSALWEPHDLHVPVGEETFSIDAPARMKVGWGELVSVGAEFFDEPIARRPFLQVGDLRCRPQLLSGWYGIEDGAWRWMAPQASVSLPAPGAATTFEMSLYFPPEHMKRAGGPVTVAVTLNGQSLGEQTYSDPGGYEFTKPLPPGLGDSTVSIRLNRWIPASGSDHRELGAVVQSLGFK